MLLVFCSCFYNSAQAYKFTAELSHPLPIDRNFLSTTFNGLADVGFKYQAYSTLFVNFGAALNGSIYKTPKEDDNSIPVFEVIAYAIQPSVFAELHLVSAPKFHPYINLGYTFLNAKAINVNAFANDNVRSTATESASGFNFNLGLAFDVSSRFFLNMQYNFTKINDTATDITFNTNINILKMGLGYRF